MKTFSTYNQDYLYETNGNLAQFPTQVKNRYDRLTIEISDVLTRLGIKKSLRGYKYLRSAVRLGLEDSESIDLITKIMYPSIAKEYGATPGRVERAIRTAICSAEKNPHTMESMLRISGHMTNKEFISELVEYMRLR